MKNSFILPSTVKLINNMFQRISNGLRRLRKAFRTNSDSDFESDKYLSTRKWEWSYLRKECQNLGLDSFYRTYIHRMQRSYLTLIFSVQALVTITHIIVLLHVLIAEEDEHDESVIPDIFIYALSLPIFIILLLPAFHDDISNSWRPFLCSFLAMICQVATDLAIPIYHAMEEHHFILRPMYASHNLLIIYIFLPIADNAVVIFMGFMTTLSYTIVMALVSYANDDDVISKILSELIFFMCINFMGIFFRLTNEIDIRSSFIDRRECVQKNLMLKFERIQEKALLLSILPEHIAEKMEKDIKNMVEKLKQRKHDKIFPALLDPRSLNVTISIPPSQRQWSATNKLYSEKHSDVTILYADVVNFTQMTTQLPVRLLVETLHELFVKFDEASAEHNVLRIKFLGDCYYCVSGVPVKNKRHAKNCVELGLRMIRDIHELRLERHLSIDMRIGIHSGSIIGGVMGANKWQYDVWSKDVIIANKIESTGVSGKIHITQSTLELLHGEYAIEEGTTAAKNEPFLVKYNIKTYLISPKYNDFSSGCNSNSISRVTSVSQLSYLEQNVIRKNFMQNSMEQFRDIMKQTNIEMERELDRMPIGKFQFFKFLTTKKLSVEQPAGTFYSTDSFIDFEELGYQAQKKKKLSRILLKFKGNAKWEWPFLNQTDPLLKYSMSMALVVLFTLFIIQVLNRSLTPMFFIYTTISSLLMMLVCFVIWFKKIWDTFSPISETNPSLVVPPKNQFLKKLYDFSYDIMSSALWRTIIYLIVVSILLTVSLMHLVEKCGLERSLHKDGERGETLSEACLNSWSVTKCIVLTICTSFLFLRIHFLLKLCVAVIIDLIYFFVIFKNFSFIFEIGLTVNPYLDPKIAHFLKVIVATIIFHLIDRHSEYMQRVGFIWKQQLLEKKEMAEITKETNKILVHNILPVHVADIYLSRQYRNDLYSEEYDEVAVMFATIMNFEASTGSIESEQRVLKSLNEIICAFDEKLMTFSGYQKVEKIKIAGWTYMAACGLDPGRGDSTGSNKGLIDGRRSFNMNLSCNKSLPERRKDAKTSLRQSKNVVITLAEFALELMRVLQRVSAENENYKNRPPLQLRVGISHGKVMAGVIGSSKPLYDIWGNSVNMASRMDSTGISGQIQVTEETANVLSSFGIRCQLRGDVYVKGKGIIQTYLISISEELEFIKEDLKSTDSSFETQL